MNTLQKWFIILALILIAVGAMINGFRGRYKLAKISETSQASGAFTSARFDTWTGQVEVYDGRHWQKGSSYYIQELK